MKSNIKYVECTDCGRKISVCNAHYLNGKPYGYNCYKKQLVLLYKQWEDEKMLSTLQSVSQLCRYLRAREAILFMIPFVSSGMNVKN